MLTTLATGFALLLFVFIRQALRGAAQTPESAEKLSRLRQALSKALGRNPSLREARQFMTLAGPSAGGQVCRSSAAVPPHLVNPFS